MKCYDLIDHSTKGRLNQKTMKAIFTAAELTVLQLECLPKARESIIRRAAREDWIKVKENSRGAHGFRFKYQVPEYVLAEISEKETQVSPTPYQSEYMPQGSVKTLLKELNYDTWATSLGISAAVPVLYFKNVFVGAGSLSLTSHNLDFMFFRADFLKELGVETTNVICVKIKGDSMHPTLPTDGVGLFDLSKRYEGEDIYLIRQVNELKVKRLQMLSNTKVRIISDNKEVYAHIDVDLENSNSDEFEILGKYLWHSGIAK